MHLERLQKCLLKAGAAQLLTLWSQLMQQKALCMDLPEPESEPDIAGAVPARISDFMGHDRTIRLSTKIDVEVKVEGQATLDIVNINLEEVRPLLDHVWVELLVPGREERVGHI